MALSLSRAIAGAPAHAQSPAATGTASNVWVLDDNGQTLATYSVLPGDWTISATPAIMMQTEITTVGEDQPLLVAYRTFVDRNLNGAPVLDDAGAVVGVVSSRDLLRAAEEEQTAAREDLHYYFGSDTLGEAEWRSST